MKAVSWTEQHAPESQQQFSQGHIKRQIQRTMKMRFQTVTVDYKDLCVDTEGITQLNRGYILLSVRVWHKNFHKIFVLLWIIMFALQNEKILLWPNPLKVTWEAVIRVNVMIDDRSFVRVYVQLAKKESSEEVTLKYGHIFSFSCREHCMCLRYSSANFSLNA